MKYAFLNLVLLSLFTFTLRGQEPDFAESEQMRVHVNAYLAESDTPWPTTCPEWTGALERKVKGVMAAYGLALWDSTMSAAAVATYLARFRALKLEQQRLYAPVLCRIAYWEEFTGGEQALSMWQESSRLIESAHEPAGCDTTVLRKWRRYVKIQGVVIHTRKGLTTEDRNERDELLERAHRLAIDAERPEMAPLPENEEQDRQPKITFFVPPDYPEEARANRIEGTVIVKILVGPDGRVMQTKLMQGVHPLLDASALIAAAEARFAPGRVGGIPVKAWMAMPYQFKLN